MHVFFFSKCRSSRGKYLNTGKFIIYNNPKILLEISTLLIESRNDSSKINYTSVFLLINKSQKSILRWYLFLKVNIRKTTYKKIKIAHINYIWINFTSFFSSWRTGPKNNFFGKIVSLGKNYTKKPEKRSVLLIQRIYLTHQNPIVRRFFTQKKFPEKNFLCKNCFIS